MRPATIQISVHILTVWSESSLGAFWITKDAKSLDAENNCAALSRVWAHLSKVQFSHVAAQIMKFRIVITKTYLYNFDPLKPYFYIVKLGFTGVYIIFFLILLKNIEYRNSLEPPHRGGSNEYPQLLFLSRNMKNIRICIWKLSVFGSDLFNIFE